MKAKSKKIRKNRKNSFEKKSDAIYFIIIFSLTVIFIAGFLIIVLVTSNPISQIQIKNTTIGTSNTTVYNFQINNLYPENIYANIGNNTFANITQYDQYQAIINSKGTIKMYFDFPQNANAQVFLNISYFDNSTHEYFVMKGLSGSREITGEAIPSIITINVKNDGNEPLNGFIRIVVNNN
jgi:hypothetical protein